MRIKVCGVSNWKEANTAITLGAHALGFVLYGKNSLALEVAREIVLKIPPFVSVVGVFKEQPYYEVEELITFLKLDCLQFNGNEEKDYLTKFNLPVLKQITTLDYDLINEYTNSNIVPLLNLDIETLKKEYLFISNLQRKTNLILSISHNYSLFKELLKKIRPYGINIFGSKNYQVLIESGAINWKEM